VSAQPAESPVEILLVEDSPGDVDLTVEALSESGARCRVSVAADGVEAMQFLRREGRFAGAPVPALILLDMNLPKKSGREVLAEVKSDPKLRHIPVVILTTSRAERDVLDAYALHANCYITKPVDLDRFLAVVRSIQDFWLSTVALPGR
jgi:two-component system, chemotaxis family, response regulator Rcp1